MADARELLAAWDAGSGAGVVTHRGRMVENLHVEIGAPADRDRRGDPGPRLTSAGEADGGLPRQRLGHDRRADWRTAPASRLLWSVPTRTRAGVRMGRGPTARVVLRGGRGGRCGRAERLRRDGGPVDPRPVERHRSRRRDVVGRRRVGDLDAAGDRLAIVAPGRGALAHHRHATRRSDAHGEHVAQRPRPALPRHRRSAAGQQPGRRPRSRLHRRSRPRTCPGATPGAGCSSSRTVSPPSATGSASPTGRSAR